MFWIYILREEKSGRLYIGSTAALERRLAEHRRTRAQLKLIYKENRDTQEAALRRELYLKSGNGRRALKNILPVAGSGATRQAGERL